MNSFALSGGHEFEVSLENLVEAAVGTHNLKTPTATTTVVHFRRRRLRLRRVLRALTPRRQGIISTRPKAFRDSM